MKSAQVKGKSWPLTQISTFIQTWARWEIIILHGSILNKTCSDWDITETHNQNKIIIDRKWCWPLADLYSTNTSSGTCAREAAWFGESLRSLARLETKLRLDQLVANYHPIRTNYRCRPSINQSALDSNKHQLGCQSHKHAQQESCASTATNICHYTHMLKACMIRLLRDHVIARRDLTAACSKLAPKHKLIFSKNV